MKKITYQLSEFYTFLFMLIVLLPRLGFSEQTAEKVVRIPRGQIIEKIESVSDENMSYAIYLPKNYEEVHKWPLLIAMDPRGRALIPMELYREAAERLGYIIVSSYNTQSDAEWTPNVKAMKAIMADIPQMFAIDNRRIYLTGFSGTAMGSWSFANNLQPHVAGLINFCGATFEWSEPKKGASYSFFGASGTRDFNYEEMRLLEKTLNSIGIAHRVLYFDGAHEWGSQEICSEGLEWMELQAMKSHLRSQDQQWIDDLFEKRTERARQLESNGQSFEGYSEYQSITRDFSGLEPLQEILVKVEILGKSKSVKQTIRKMDRLAKDQLEFVRKLFAYLNEIRFPSGTNMESVLLNDLKISSLIDKGSHSKDRLEALWAQRMLEIAFVQSSFYGPRDFLESKDARRALRLLVLADQIKPNHERVLYMKAWAYVVAGDEKNALKSLNKMLELRYISSADTIVNDPHFELLRENAGFKELIGKLRQTSQQ